MLSNRKKSLSMENYPLLGPRLKSIATRLKKKAMPKDHLDLETFELMMSLLDDISTQP